MQITRTADYGVRVLTHLAMLPPGTRLTAAELAGESHASVTFVAKILQRLVASRLVVSRRGFEGGFELGRDPKTVSLLDVITALDGPLCLNECLPGGPGCESATTCGSQDVWKRAQAALLSVLAAETLDRLAVASTRSSHNSNSCARSRAGICARCARTPASRARGSGCGVALTPSRAAARPASGRQDAPMFASRSPTRRCSG